MTVTTDALLPTPPAGPEAATDWVRKHLGDLTLEGREGADGLRASQAFRGGQAAADAALAALDITGYATRRSTVDPEQGRGASRLSPYIRHGLIPLPQLWKAVAGAPARDRERFRDELLWQEYARHLYARTGSANAHPLRYAQPTGDQSDQSDQPDVARIWPAEMECLRATGEELERDGWLVNQARMWWASQWTVRHGAPMAVGENELYRRLLDGSRAANRLGWQWVAGTLTGKVYGFSRWQVEKRAPSLCRRCPLRTACPIQDWPSDEHGPRLADGPDLGRGETPAGPKTPETPSGYAGQDPAAVWLTAESLGDADPALAAHPNLPAVFVFDAPLLARLRLAGKRLVFLAETLGDLATRRDVQVLRGDPVEELAGRPLAATYAPVPGWARRAAGLDLVVVHPWPWLVCPGTAPVRSFSSWRSATRR